MFVLNGALNKNCSKDYMNLKISGYTEVFSCKFDMSNYTLIDHPDRYKLKTDGDVLLFFLSLITLSGAPYARRHWQVSNNHDINTKAFWTQKIISILEWIPIIGALITTAEFCFFAPPINQVRNDANRTEQSCQSKPWPPLGPFKVTVLAR